MQRQRQQQRQQQQPSLIGCTWNAQGDLICDPAHFARPTAVKEGFATREQVVTPQIVERQMANKERPPSVPMRANVIECDPAKKHSESECAPYGTTVACDSTYVRDSVNGEPVSANACVVPYGKY
jgi:hypothetical protein